MGYFSNPSIVLKMEKDRFEAFRKTLKWLSKEDDRAIDMLNKVNERVKYDGKFYHIPLFTDETVRFAYLFASMSEAFVGLVSSLKADTLAVQNSASDTVLALEGIFSAMENETEIVADNKMRSFSTLRREEKAYIKRYIRNGCGGALIPFGEADYEEDTRLPEIGEAYLQEVADFIGIPLSTVKAHFTEMMNSYQLAVASGYPDIGRGDKSLPEAERQAKFERLCEVIPKYSIDFNGFQYGRVLYRKMNCSESLFKRAMQWCKENA